MQLVSAQIGNDDPSVAQPQGFEDARQIRRRAIDRDQDGVQHPFGEGSGCYFDGDKLQSRRVPDDRSSHRRPGFGHSPIRRAAAPGQARGQPAQQGRELCPASFVHRLADQESLLTRSRAVTRATFSASDSVSVQLDKG